MVKGTTIREVSRQQAEEEVKLLEGATMDDRDLPGKLQDVQHKYAPLATAAPDR